jgi:hypothetical protein
VLQVLVFGLRDRLAHALHVLAGQLAQQALQIVLRLEAGVTRLGAEELRDHRAEIGPPPGRGDHAPVFIFLVAARRRTFLWAVRFLAPAVPGQTKNRARKTARKYLPK